MNNMENSSVEQLWYTWSDVGLSTIHAGFRIRAASPALTEIYSERVKNIERNTRYVLPPGTDRSITPAMAPAGLTFMRSEWHDEYLLIHKQYTGEDGVGRQGNFFAHALALGEYSREFSTEDAIWQWGASFWKTDDASLDRRSTSLTRLPIDELFNATDSTSSAKIGFGKGQFRQVQSALQFVVEAFLMRKNRSIPIYIAAPASQAAKIAWIIAGLTNCLPAQLINGLTFSTYEPDITKATTEIVGTSWIAIPGKGQDATAVLPRSAYLDRLAINCETGERSNLQSHAHTIYNQLAADFAAYAAGCLATGATESLYSLRDYADTSRDLDSALFLQLYYNQIVNTTSMDEVGIEKHLNSDLCANWLSQDNSRQKVIDRAIANPVWAQGRLNAILLTLRGQAEREVVGMAQSARSSTRLSVDSGQMAAAPEIQTRRARAKGAAKTKKAPATLTHALTLLAGSMIPAIVRCMKQAQSPAGTRPGEHRRLVDTVVTLLHLMDSCLSPQDPTEVWKQLFEKIEGSEREIEGSKAVTAFITSEWSIQSWLLKVWSNVLPADWQEDNKMRPLLRIQWSRLGDFLRLGLQKRHPQWIVFPLQELITDPKALTPQIAKELELNYAREIAILLTTLQQGQHLKHEAILIVRLVEKGYTIQAQLESHIEQLLEALNRDSPLYRIAKDLVTAILDTGYTGSDLYQRQVGVLTRNLLITLPTDGHALVEALIEHNFPRNWLVDLLIENNGNPVDLLSVIQYVYPTPEGQNTFFLEAGARYLKHKNYMQDMQALYQQLLPLKGKLDRLFILLDATSDRATIFSLLKLAPLGADEWYAILQRYGQGYLQSAQPVLVNIVVKNFAHLVNAGYPNELLFNMLPQQPEAGYLEALLEAAVLTPQQQIRFLETYGQNYILHYPQMSILLDFITLYITNFHINSLDREEARNFFQFLTHNYKTLNLNTQTANSIEKWRTINDYFTAPSMEPDKLRALVSALYALNLPDAPYFTVKLARAFSFCIRTAQDISQIMTSLQFVPTLQNDAAERYRFLYALASAAAEQSHNASSRQISPGTLTPYLLFALALPPQEGSAHFFTLFLDKLFYYGNVSYTPLWVSMNDIVEAHGLSTLAIERWHMYLYKLEIWDKINAQQKRRFTLRLPQWGAGSGEQSAIVEQGKPSRLQRLHSVRLPWSRPGAEALPPNSDVAHSHSSAAAGLPVYPVPGQPGDAQYSGSRGSNPSDSNQSANKTHYHTYDH